MTNLLDVSPKELEREIQKIIAQARPRNRPWRKQEVEILTKLYEGGVRVPDISKAIGRSSAAVTNAATRFGLKR